MLSLQTFKSSVFGALNIDTPINDPKWRGRFVERIRASDRESSTGLIDFLWAFVNSAKKVAISLHTCTNLGIGAFDIDTPTKDV